MIAAVSILLSIASAEEGYLEKATNAQLDDKTANAGSGNYTKYARDIDNISGFYNGKKNGYAWCDVFVDWCFVQAFGAEKALQLLCQPWGNYGASVASSKSYYQSKKQFHTGNPQPGDQIFFSGHTGIVYDVDANKVYTIEGNTSSEPGVVANGGAVRKKSYNLTYSGIEGYGRPDWSIVGSNIPPEYISANRFLTMEEMRTNARYIYWYLSSRGWTLNAVAGMLGNMQTESTINPGIWQNLAVNVGPAFGLVQWDPFTKYTNWCAEKGLDPAAMDSALQRIEWELANGEQYYATEDYPETFAEFKVSKKAPYYLGMAFLRNYERPADPNQPTRGTQAEKWYTYLYGIDPGTGGGGGTGTTKKRTGYNFILFGKKRRILQ